MRIIRYFVELLDTLKRIEAHLAKVTSCVEARAGYSAAVRTKPYNH